EDGLDSDGPFPDQLIKVDQEAQLMEQMVRRLQAVRRHLGAEAAVEQDVLVDDARRRLAPVVMTGQQHDGRLGKADVEAGEITALVLRRVVRHQFASGTGYTEGFAQSF